MIGEAEESVSVSVPLRGCGFEIDPLRNQERDRRQVSVPLRGFGFEMFAKSRAFSLSGLSFPSPCGDVVLKSVVYGAVADSRSVSVPLRGCGFEILASESLVPRGSEWRFAARIG